MDQPAIARVVALGASNLTRGLHTVVSTARAAWGPGVEVLGALGHGRSYGVDSRLVVRTLPGILQSGLWSALESLPPAATRGLVTDVGNDILYGFTAPTILEWVEESVDRLQRVEHVTYVSALGCVLAIAQMYAGDLDASLRNHLAANAIDRSLGDEHGLARGLVNESMTLLSAGDAAAALARADEAEALSERLGDAIGATHVGMIRARAALLAGRFDEAVDRLCTVLDDAEAGADTGLLRVDLAYALVRRGDLSEAAAELALAAAVSGEQDLTWLAVQPVAAVLAAEEGDTARAGEIAASARAEFAARGFGWPFTVDRLAGVGG